jgi:hypothetical protein
MKSIKIEDFCANGQIMLLIIKVTEIAQRTAQCHGIRDG